MPAPVRFFDDLARFAAAGMEVCAKGGWNGEHFAAFSQSFGQSYGQSCGEIYNGKSSGCGAPPRTVLQMQVGAYSWGFPLANCRAAH